MLRDHSSSFTPQCTSPPSILDNDQSRSSSISRTFGINHYFAQKGDLLGSCSLQSVCLIVKCKTQPPPRQMPTKQYQHQKKPLLPTSVNCYFRSCYNSRRLQIRASPIPPGFSKVCKSHSVPIPFRFSLHSTPFSSCSMYAWQFHLELLRSSSIFSLFAAIPSLAQPAPSQVRVKPPKQANQARMCDYATGARKPPPTQAASNSGPTHSHVCWTFSPPQVQAKLKLVEFCTIPPPSP